MKRRNFLTGLLGLSIIPPLAKSNTMSKIEQQKSVNRKNWFNYNNIKIDGTFEEWVKSIAKEIERLFNTKSKAIDAEWFDSKCYTNVTSSKWSDNGDEILAIIINFTNSYLTTNLSFTKFEFERNQKQPKFLRQLLEVRFIDCIWSMYDVIRNNILMLEKVGIDCSKPAQ